MSTAPTHSLLATVPAALHDKANRLAWALGYQPEDGDTFSIILDTPEGERCGFIQFVTDSFRQLLADAKAGRLRDIQWKDFGLSEADVTEVVTALEIIERPVGKNLKLASDMKAVETSRGFALKVAAAEVAVSQESKADPYAPARRQT